MQTFFVPTDASLKRGDMFYPNQAARVPSPQEMTMLTQHIMQQVWFFTAYVVHVFISTSL